MTPDNIERLIHGGDIVILAVDNHATRKLASDFCTESRDDICLISGGNDGVGEDSSGRLLRGTYGNCQIYVRRGGIDCTPSLTLLHPRFRIRRIAFPPIRAALSSSPPSPRYCSPT